MGFTSLVCIVVNNSIILVDYTNQLVQQGLSQFDAIVKACQTRFKPIVLTSITTILGLLPLTLGQTNLWSPLGWTIIGGMLTSTFLVLLLVPILYRFFSAEGKVEAWGGYWGGRRKAPLHHGVWVRWRRVGFCRIHATTLSLLWSFRADGEYYDGVCAGLCGQPHPSGRFILLVTKVLQSSQLD